jgi:hypothetical protein
MVQNVKRAANAHASANFVPIDASLAEMDMPTRGTVAKRTNVVERRRAARARVCRILGVAETEQQR